MRPSNWLSAPRSRHVFSPPAFVSRRGWLGPPVPAAASRRISVARSLGLCRRTGSPQVGVNGRNNRRVGVKMRLTRRPRRRSVPTPSSASNTIRARCASPARNDGDRVHRVNSARSSTGICTPTVNDMQHATAKQSYFIHTTPVRLPASTPLTRLPNSRDQLLGYLGARRAAGRTRRGAARWRPVGGLGPRIGIQGICPTSQPVLDVWPKNGRAGPRAGLLA
jgi:hypothetical protein